MCIRDSISPLLSFQFQGSIRSHRLRINWLNDADNGQRERRDLNTSGGVRMRISTKGLKSLLLFNYMKEDQKYLRAADAPSSPYSGSNILTAPDNVFSMATLSWYTGWRFLPSDSLYFYATMQRFRYDTPDPDNFDDRDELRMRIMLQEIHHFSPQLSMRLLLSTHFIHFVYIYGQRSADNNWNRILRFAPALIWQPSHAFRFSQTAEVLANYVDYDYEAEFLNTRSFLYRKFQMEDSTQIHLTSRLQINLLYRLELDENGKFLWNQWVEQRLTDRQSHTLSVSLDYQPVDHLHIVPGIELFDRKGYRYTPATADNDKYEQGLFNHFRSSGPFLRIRYLTNRIRLLLAASTIATRTLQISKKLLTRIDLKACWLF